MATRKKIPDPVERPTLTTARSEADLLLQKQIAEGEELAALAVRRATSPDDLSEKSSQWTDNTAELLRKLFTNGALAT